MKKNTCKFEVFFIKFVPTKSDTERRYKKVFSCIKCKCKFLKSK